MILALGFPKGWGTVSAPHLIVINHGLMPNGKNTHDTDLTVRPWGDDAITRQLSVAVRPLNLYVQSLGIGWVHLLPIVIA